MLAYFLYGVKLQSNQVERFNADNPIHTDEAKLDPENPSYLSYCSGAGRKTKIGVLQRNLEYSLFIGDKIVCTADDMIVNRKFLRKPRNAEKYIQSYLDKYNLKSEGEIGWILCLYERVV